MYGLDDALAFYQAYKATVDTLSKLKSVYVSRIVSIDSLQQSIQQSEVDFGDEIRVSGIFSDFVPITRDLAYESSLRNAPLLLGSLPCRPFSIDDHYCAAVQSEDEILAGTTNSIPIFYKDETPRPTYEYLSGYRVVVDGKLISLSEEWSQLLDLETPIGIQVTNIEIAGDPVDELGLIFWKVVKDEGESDVDVGRATLMMIREEAELWMSWMRVDQNRLLAVHGWGSNHRHGCIDEDAEEVVELHATNIMHDDLFDSQKNHMNNRLDKYPLELGWDMRSNPSKYSDWIQQKL
ncbi:hypothetical protein [Halobellus salinisoli]|uniref:hypothetical protein n=1 Tax=Halobellus salinisoli TaxID=3108500 RepID=UPI003009FEAC